MTRQIINQPKVCVILPTYNEAGNISNLLDSIFKHVDEENKKRHSSKKAFVEVLVADDNSPDKTFEIVEDYMKKERRVNLLKRETKEGLGAAYKAAMKHAIKELSPDIIFEMDADFSHSPNDIFRMIDAIMEGNDFVIGSRYIEGGSTPEGWGIHRKFISYSARTITRTFLRLGKIKDCSGGFRAMKKEVIEDADLDNLLGDGYGFQVALLESAVHNNYKIKEIPIDFGNRNTGTSKMRFSDALEGWSIIFKIRIRRMKQKKTKNETEKTK